jgi:hypothetical protein
MRRDAASNAVIQAGLREGDGLCFYAKKTERGYWNFLYTSSLISNLREHYAQADCAARTCAADLACSSERAPQGTLS